MPRRARISVPGIAWHIIQRGNNRSPCFFAHEDYQKYLSILRKQAQSHACQVHAYVLMTNHVHLLITPEHCDSASVMMKHLGQRYVQYVNRTYRRSGTLWEGRFRSCLAQSQAYVLTCYRYIEFNPVRANMVEHPTDYPWSSFHANAHGAEDPILTPHPEYTALGGTHSQRREAYRDLFGTRLDPALIDQIRAATNGNYVLGNDRFKKEVTTMLRRRVIPGRSGRPRKVRG